MTGIGESLTDKLGPLPVWAWGGLAGAAILGGSAILKRVHPSTATPASTSAALAPASTTTPTDSVPAASSALGSFMAAGTYVPPGSSSSSTSSSTYTSNDEWARAAKTLLVAKYDTLSNVEINDAIDRALNGDQITQAQQAIFELALKIAGPTPQSYPYLNVVKVTAITTPQPNPSPATEPRQNPNNTPSPATESGYTKTAPPSVPQGVPG